LKCTLIRTQASAPVNGQHALNFGVWTRNDVNTNQLADPARRRCSSVGCCLHRPNVAANKDRHITGADVLFSQEHNIRSFDHRVSGLDRSDETLGLHHSECF
jgi:hypothetical protein